MEDETLKRKDSEEGRMIHKLAEEEREHGDLNIAVELHSKAASVFEKDDDRIGQAEALSGKVIDYRHLARKTKDVAFLSLAEETAKDAVKIAESSGIKEASVLPLFNLATVQEELGNFSDAAQSYREALNRPLPIRHNKPAVRVNMQVHLAACEYKTGDKDALVRAEEWLTKLDGSEHDNEYEHDVWVSGGHMRIADAIKKDDKQSALDHMSKAKDIIDKDPKQFKLRQEQWHELSKTI